MPESNPAVRVVLTTTATQQEAERLGRTLVEERLVACATVIPGAQSIYRWQGEVETASETVLLLKTGPEQLPALEIRMHTLHSYQTPEFIVLRVDGGSTDYLEWVYANLLRP